MFLIIALIVGVLFIVYAIKILSNYPKCHYESDSLTENEAKRRLLAEDDEKQYSTRGYRTK